METKSSGVAIVLSFFWTGLGQLYAGRIGRGIAMMIVTPVLWGLGMSVGGCAACAGLLGGMTPSRPGVDLTAQATGAGAGGLILMLIPLAWWIWGMVDAKKLCEAWNKQVGS